jgi:glycerophosphoryl diester phosphodiesterase
MTDEPSTPQADDKRRSPGCLRLAGYILLALLLIPILYYGLYLLFKGPQPAGRQVIAHRGDSAHAPENTLSAFQGAVQSGAGWLEMDLQRTRDGRLVVMHDATVDRTTDGSGNVADLTFDEIRSLKIGDGERVPAFEEAIALARAAGVGLFPEAKSKDQDPGAYAAIVAALQQEGYLQQTILQSFDHEGLEAITAANPDLIVCPLYGLWGLSLSEVRPDSAKTVCPMGEMILLNPWMVRRAHQDGRLVYAWFGAIENPLTMRLLLALGVDGLIVDDPAALEKIVNP